MHHVRDAERHAAVVQEEGNGDYDAGNWQERPPLSGENEDFWVEIPPFMSNNQEIFIEKRRLFTGNTTVFCIQMRAFSLKNCWFEQKGDSQAKPPGSPGRGGTRAIYILKKRESLQPNINDFFSRKSRKKPFFNRKSSHFPLEKAWFLWQEPRVRALISHR